MSEEMDDFDALRQVVNAEVIASVERIEQQFGIELQSLFTAAKCSDEESLKEIRQRIIQGVNAYSGFALEEEIDIHTSESAIELVPNIFISRKNSLAVRDYTNSQVYDWLMRTVRKDLKTIGYATSVEDFVKWTLEGSIIAVGVPMAEKVAAALSAQKTFKDALTAAVEKIGLRSAMAAVAMAFVCIMRYLFTWDSGKILGAIINDTDTNYYVPDWRKGVNGSSRSNIYMQHGRTEDFMTASLTSDPDSPEIQLQARYVGTDDENTIVAVGLFVARSENSLRRLGGAYVFIPHHQYENGPGFAYQFAFSISADWRANITVYEGGKIDNGASFSQLFIDMYGSAQIDIEKKSGDLNMKSHLGGVSDMPRLGGPVNGIATVSTPIVYKVK